MYWSDLAVPELGSEVGCRDVIVVGASAGGLEAIGRLLQRLPADLPAALFIVLHTADHEAGLLARVLDRRSALPVATAAEDDVFVRGHVYVAPPDCHLIVGRDHIHVRRGPRENGARPAIDPLFRSAAATCTTRVIGLVLSGLLNDGTAGLKAIKRCGGVAIVQDPADAAVEDMPRSALRHVQVDHVVPVDTMASLLVGLTAQPPPPAPEVPNDIMMEALIAAQEVRGMKFWSEAGSISPITCPDCHGAMKEIRDGDLVRFRCHTGHTFTLEALDAFQLGAWERALYGAYRSQQERALLLRRMVEESIRTGSPASAQLEARASSYEEGAELLQRLIASNGLDGPQG